MSDMDVGPVSGGSPELKSEPDRIASKTLMLTYDHVEDGLTGDDVAAMVKCILEAKDWGWTKCVYTEEPHQKSGYHVHIAFLFTKKHNLKDMTAFDLVGWNDQEYHPNFKVRRGRDAWNKHCEYVSKRGYPKGDSMIWGYKNYRKEKGDWDAWQQDMKTLHASNAFPIDWVDGLHHIEKPTSHERKCIFVCVGDSDWGKSYWVYKNLKPYTYFKVTNGAYPMEGYGGQQIILYDDFDWNSLKQSPEELIIAQGSYYNMDTKVGHCRYQDAYYKANQQNIIIILTNVEKRPAWLDVTRIKNRTAVETRVQVDG